MFFLHSMFSQYPRALHNSNNIVRPGRKEVVLLYVYSYCVRPPQRLITSLPILYIYNRYWAVDTRSCDDGGEYRLAGPLFRQPAAGGRPTSPCQVSVLWMHGRVIAVITLMISYFALFFRSYNLVYVTSDGDACEGSLPAVEMASRSGSMRQQFNEWSLVQYYTGERNCYFDAAAVLLYSSCCYCCFYYCCCWFRSMR